MDDEDIEAMKYAADESEQPKFDMRDKISIKRKIAIISITIICIASVIAFGLMLASNGQDDDGFAPEEFGELAASFTVYVDQEYEYDTYVFKATAIVSKDKHVRMEIWKDGGFYDEKRLYMEPDRYYMGLEGYVLALDSVNGNSASFKLYYIIE